MGVQMSYMPWELNFESSLSLDSFAGFPSEEHFIMAPGNNVHARKKASFSTRSSP